MLETVSLSVIMRASTGCKPTPGATSSHQLSRLVAYESHQVRIPEKAEPLSGGPSDISNGTNIEHGTMFVPFQRWNTEQRKTRNCDFTTVTRIKQCLILGIYCISLCSLFRSKSKIDEQSVVYRCSPKHERFQPIISQPHGLKVKMHVATREPIVIHCKERCDREVSIQKTENRIPTLLFKSP